MLLSILGSHKDNSIDHLKLEMVYGFCDELQSAQPLKFQPPFLGMFCKHMFHHGHAPYM